MALYGKFSPALVQSALPDYSSNLLPALDEYTFTATKRLMRLGGVLSTANGWKTTFDFYQWTAIHAVYARNYSTSSTNAPLYVSFLPYPGAASSEQSYMTLNPGESAIFPGIAPSGNVFSSGHPFSLDSDHTALASVTFDLIVLGE